MKSFFKYIVPLILLFFAAGGLNAQQQELQQSRITADSLQRVWMRQNLQISDTVVDRVLIIRDSMYAQVNAVRTSSHLSAEQQESAAMEIRTAAELAIRETLGNTAYGLYTARIRQRLQQSGQTNAEPLTGTAN